MASSSKLTEEERRNGQELVREHLSAPWDEGIQGELQRWLLEHGASLFAAAERGLEGRSAEIVRLRTWIDTHRQAKLGQDCTDSADEDLWSVLKGVK